MYGCFVDFSSAFDSLNRDLLMYVLQKYGIQNDFANIIKVLYKGTACAIKLNDKTTEWFPTYAGVRQGQNDSTTLFAMFVNSIADKINTLGILPFLCFYMFVLLCFYMFVLLPISL